MNKPITLIFCGKNETLAREIAQGLRTGANQVVLCLASPHDNDARIQDRVLIMPDVDVASRQNLHRLFPKAEDIKEPEQAPPPVQEPPKSSGNNNGRNTLKLPGNNRNRVAA